MEKIVFNSYESLAERMIDVAKDGDTAYAVCFFNDAIEVMRELLMYQDITVGGINISQDDYSGYSKEYYISIDGNGILDVEPAWHKSNEYTNAGYYWFEAEKIFIVGEANSAIIKNIDKEKCYEIEFKLNSDNEDIINRLLEECEIHCDENGIPNGIYINTKTIYDLIFGE